MNKCTKFCINKSTIMINHTKQIIQIPNDNDVLGFIGFYLDIFVYSRTHFILSPNLCIVSHSQLC